MVDNDARGAILGAISAVEEKQKDPDVNPTLAAQLTSALSQLRAMLAAVDGGDAVHDFEWLGQMVADQWDPRWPVTERVLHVTQALDQRKSGS